MNKRRYLIMFICVVIAFLNNNASAEDPGIENLLFAEIPTVVTASKKAQPITEAPAVLTVVTAKEIRETGARTLMDILKTIPGFIILQDTNEHLAVLHGVYASTNQKFLVLRDGHRLNEWVWNSAEHDYCLSLANVKRIEIIRGPGSSLYGSAALEAVINIITNDGTDIDGLDVTIGAGNPAQIKGDLVYGREQENGNDLMIFGSFYQTLGEKISTPASRDGSRLHPINGYETVDKRDPNYDLGLKLHDGKFQFSASLQNSNYYNPRGNAGQLFDPATIPLVDYKQIFRTAHLDLAWEDKIGSGGATVKLRHYWDYLYWFSWQLVNPERDYPAGPYGQLFSWDVQGCSFGLDYSLSMPFSNGSIIVGIQPEQRELLSSEASRNYSTISTSAPVRQSDAPLKPGGENYLAGYMQVDQKISDHVTAIAGARYDRYQDVGDAVNPRLALIWSPEKNFYWKFMYNRAFLNPSYFYRYVTGVMGYYGGPNLKAEVMDSYQSEMTCYFGKSAVGRIAGFYNALQDLVAPDLSVPGRSTYKNYGRVNVWGIEPELRLTLFGRVELFANYTFQIPDRYQTDAAQMKDDRLKNVPSEMANIGITCCSFAPLTVNLLANWHGTIESPSTAGTAYGPDYEIPAETIYDLNVTVMNFWQAAELTVTVKNLLDTEYYLGGTTLPYRQPGRWILASIGYKF